MRFFFNFCIITCMCKLLVFLSDTGTSLIFGKPGVICPEKEAVNQPLTI